MQALQNHFILVDGRQDSFQPSKSETVQICDVKTGVGADQLLVIEPPTKSGAAVGSYAAMRIINIDGNDVEACGNATRCFAWLMLEETGLDEITVETVVGPLRCQRVDQMQVRVEMGKISTLWNEIPLAHEVDTLQMPVRNGPLRDGVALNIGNPHIVYFVEDLDAIDVATVSLPVQNDPLFPTKVNVGVAQKMNDSHLRLSVYERPGILTQSCGSGACVAARAAQLLGLSTRSSFRVEMAGGEVEINLNEKTGIAELSGPVDYCFSGRLTGREGHAA